MPDLVGCRRCGCFEAPAMLFDPLEGNLLCGGCAGEDPSAAMRHIVFSEMDRLFSFQLPAPDLECLLKTVETYLLMRTEQKYTSLDYYKSLL